MFVYDNHVQQFNKYQKEAFMPLLGYLPDIHFNRTEQTTAIINQWAYMLHGRCEAMLPMYDAQYIAERIYPLTIGTRIDIIPIPMNKEYLIRQCTPGPRSSDSPDRVDSWCVYGGPVDCFYTGHIPEDDRGPMAVLVKAFTEECTVKITNTLHPMGDVEIPYRRLMYFLYIYIPPKMR